MLVLCNGAYKSGSTWLFNIAVELTGFGFPPPSFLDKTWRNPSIDTHKLTKFIETCALSEHNYISKQHIFSPDHCNLILSTPNIVVLNIKRDLRDVLVSAYHHHRRDGRFVGSFANFYWVEGRMIAHHVKQYHEMWRARDGKVFVASYEDLHADFNVQVQQIAAFLGLSTSGAQLQRVREATRIESLRVKYGEAGRAPDQQFFREGAVGAWREHFTPPMLEELRAIEAHGLAWPKRLQSRARIKLHRTFRAYPRKLFAGSAKTAHQSK